MAYDITKHVKQQDVKQYKCTFCSSLVRSQNGRSTTA